MVVLAPYSSLSLTKTLPITIGSTGYRFYAQNRLAMPARQPGDISQVTAKCEITSAVTYKVMVGCFIAFGMPGASHVEPPPLSLPRTFDITAYFFGHQRIEEQALITDERLANAGLDLEQPEGWTVSFVLYAASDLAVSGDTLKIEAPGYSEMWALHFQAEGV